MGWKQVVEELKSVTVVSQGDNELVVVKGQSDKLQCIGVGTDAAVFRCSDAPAYAFKVFSHDKFEKMESEIKVYEKLGSSSYFPIYYGSGINFIVLSYEKGVTLYECLVNGIHIPSTAIQDVEMARLDVREKGLNPRDIHLRNILLYKGRAKLLDVSEYMKDGDDKRWQYLVEGYRDYYHLLDGKPIPLWMIETVRKWFNQTKKDHFNFNEFAERLFVLFRSVNRNG